MAKRSTNLNIGYEEMGFCLKSEVASGPTVKQLRHLFAVLVEHQLPHVGCLLKSLKVNTSVLSDVHVNFLIFF